jgi:hypothetical protein
MAWSLKKIAIVSGGTVVGGAVCFATAGAAAPAVGAFIGSTFMGLSGAAATSAGLAAVGGGALAAGGGGMAAGTAIITASLTGAGSLLGTLGMGTVANFFKNSNKEFEQAISDQKDYAKAQKIILQQQSKINELKNKLALEKKRTDTSEEKIERLVEAISKLQTVIKGNQGRLKVAKAA